MKPTGYYYVYILTNKRNTVLYTGVTNNLSRRILEHKIKLNNNCFTSIYNVCKLVYYEKFDIITDAIIREKQIKAGSRKNKEELIDENNSKWEDYLEGVEDCEDWF